MFCRMFVGGCVTTSDMSAGQTETEMDPARAHLQTIFASVCGWFHFPDLIQMLAITRHQYASAIEDTDNLLNSAIPLTVGIPLCYRIA